MAKQAQTMEELLKQQRAARNALKTKITAENYSKLMTALKKLNPGKKDAEIIALYEAQAAEIQTEA